MEGREEGRKKRETWKRGEEGKRKRTRFPTTIPNPILFLFYLPFSTHTHTPTLFFSFNLVNIRMKFTSCSQIILQKSGIAVRVGACAHKLLSLPKKGHLSLFLFSFSLSPCLFSLSLSLCLSVCACACVHISPLTDKTKAKQKKSKKRTIHKTFTVQKDKAHQQLPDVGPPYLCVDIMGFGPFYNFLAENVTGVDVVCVGVTADLAQSHSNHETHTYTHKYTYTHTNTYAYAYTTLHITTYIHTHTHTHTYAHTYIRQHAIKTGNIGGFSRDEGGAPVFLAW